MTSIVHSSFLKLLKKIKEKSRINSITKLRTILQPLNAHTCIHTHPITLQCIYYMPCFLHILWCVCTCVHLCLLMCGCFRLSSAYQVTKNHSDSLKVDLDAQVTILHFCIADILLLIFSGVKIRIEKSGVINFVTTSYVGQNSL